VTLHAPAIPPKPAGFILEEWADRFKLGRLPPKVYRASLAEDGRLAPLLAYVNGPHYAADKRAGIGVHLYGDTTSRLAGFPCLCRAMILKHDNVLYISLVDLLHALTEDKHPLADDIDDAAALFVTGMHDDFDFPFTGYQRYVVQNFLTRRFERGQRNCYSTSEASLPVTWWSSEFIAYQSQHVRHLKV